MLQVEMHNMIWQSKHVFMKFTIFVLFGDVASRLERPFDNVAHT